VSIGERVQAAGWKFCRPLPRIEANDDDAYGTPPSPQPPELRRSRIKESTSDMGVFASSVSNGCARIANMARCVGERKGHTPRLCFRYTHAP
jgi:hypothetical protein